MTVVREGGLWCRAADEPGGDALVARRRALAKRTIAHLQVAMPATNLDGAAIVFAYYFFAFTPPDLHGFATPAFNALALAVLFPIFATRGRLHSRAALVAAERWADGEEADADDRRRLLDVPWTMTKVSASNWALAVPIFFLINSDHSLELACEVAVTIALAGVSVSALVYLVAERLMRPMIGEVLSADAPPDHRALGIGTRVLGTWALLAGVPLVMIGLIPLGRVPDDPRALILPIWFVIVAALVVGAVGMKLAAEAIARPVRELRRALEAVEEGRTDVVVTVTDASEIGRLQAGFNDMVSGLRERALLRELFGRQVGDDVAREALERGVTLGGQTRIVSTLFVDVIGSTALASRESPERVVAILNEFFAAVVDVVGRHHGLVNKFEGDGAMCIFGAPVEREDHATEALAAGRELSARLRELRRAGTPLEAAIGISCGTVVAGHVGAEERYEYTVIGDPVNEAARLRDLAKSRPGLLLASAATVEHASPEEAARWLVDGEARLRGRGVPTALAVPRVAEAGAVSVA
jgi:adenylate cyclase